MSRKGFVEGFIHKSRTQTTKGFLINKCKCNSNLVKGENVIFIVTIACEIEARRMVLCNGALSIKESRCEKHQEKNVVIWYFIMLNNC